VTRSLIAMLVGGALLAGCANGLEPAYHRPEPAVPTAFPSGPAYAPPPAQTVTTPGWREVFVDGKLRRSKRRALSTTCSAPRSCRP
jgi:multidrug efflux system outer membrane protein